MSFQIYNIENSVNGMLYVGITTVGLRKRFIIHRSMTQRLKHLPLYRAFLKYGNDAFTIHLIEECSNLEMLKERERFWIKQLKCRAPNGYNVTDGGEANSGRERPEMAAINRARCLGKHLSEEHRRKVGEAGKGRHHSQKSKDLMSVKLKEAWKHRRGTPEAIRHLANMTAISAAANRGKKMHDLGQERRDKISCSQRKRWANMPDEKRKEFSIIMSETATLAWKRRKKVA